MDGMMRADLQAVVAPLNFMEPMAEKPFSYNYDPPPGMPVRNGTMIEHRVTVHDARPVNDALSLDRSFARPKCEARPSILCQRQQQVVPYRVPFEHSRLLELAADAE